MDGISAAFIDIVRPSVILLCIECQGCDAPLTLYHISDIDRVPEQLHNRIAVPGHAFVQRIFLPYLLIVIGAGRKYTFIIKDIADMPAAVARCKHIEHTRNDLRGLFIDYQLMLISRAADISKGRFAAKELSLPCADRPCRSDFP